MRQKIRLPLARIRLYLTRIWRFLITLLDALVKAAPVFIIQFLAIYPLAANGQGREAMRALLDDAPANIAIFLFPLALSYSCVLTAAFSFFLLDRWNFSAPDSASAFCRIWVPAVFTLIVGLLWPAAAGLDTNGETLWDAIIGLINGGGVLMLLVAAWRQTKPSVGPKKLITMAALGATLLLLFANGFLTAFYVATFAAATIICAFARHDFRDDNQNFRPWPTIHSVALTFALLLVGGVLLLSNISVPWRMFIGAPTALMCGFTFMVGLAFLLSALLSRTSPVLFRVVWVFVAAVLLTTPLGHEPLRLLPAPPAIAAAQPTSRLPPSAHFAEWLRARPGVLNDSRPYPVFFVAAKGGGVRAAYWTATLLAGLEERYPGFTDHVYAISGVSGGSVGGAIYAAMYRDLPAAGERGCAPLKPERVHGLRPCTAYVFQWDLLGPALSGLLLNDLPFGWRGVRRAGSLEEGLEYAWAATMETRRFEEPFGALWEGRPFSVPSLILNTTSADNGRRIVVSNLMAAGQITAEPDVEAIVGRPLRLSTAAFLSARFPLISPLATFDSPAGEQYRLADGGYFDNSGLASTASLLRSVLPVTSAGEFANRIRPIVLVISNSPVAGGLPPRTPGSLAEALYGPVSVLTKTGEAHEETYLNETKAIVGDEWVADDLRPPADSAEVALGWLLSAQTRCEMDRSVNKIINESKGSLAIERVLGSGETRQASWSSCSAQP